VEKQKDQAEAHTVGGPSATQDTKGKAEGQDARKWEGPFITTATSNEAAFKLRRLTGEEEPYTWNVDMLQKYFV
jgi:hypothetical protein